MAWVQVNLQDGELAALREIARRTGQSVPGLIRQAIRRVWLEPGGHGMVGLWDGPVARTSLDHDSVYD